MVCRFQIMLRKMTCQNFGMFPLLLMMLLCLLPTIFSQSWGSPNHDRVLLSDIQTLTLHKGKMTAARRVQPMPQLSCMGGSAGCKAFSPDVVQCYNRGSDGMDVQWECKTDMSNDYKFGKIEVVCEGYDSPDDPTVLKGSCGLEYSLDLTDAGRAHGREHYTKTDSDSSRYRSKDQAKNPWYINWIFLLTVVFFVYILYKNCIRQNQYSPTNSDDPATGPFSGSSNRGSGSYGGPPPPYPGTDSSSFPGDSCGAQYQARPTTGGRGGGPGFWSGLGAGAGLGYLFGRRNTNTGYGGGMFGGGGGSMFGGGGGYSRGPSYNPSFGGGSSSYSSGSSGSREASGFGGTRRR